uniref:F-box protein SNE-like n=1 Tax=Erigeron canadensis TaxID=72917 RepID=UPI001CB9A844|nr:F-box protein SNE-like [Erigeron canadensis]
MMVQIHHENEEMLVDDDENSHDSSTNTFFINDNIDILIEILTRLDGRSLSTAACVCKQWCLITRNDSIWEHLCFRNVSPPPIGVRPIVSALGGFKRLYMVCVRPVLSRLKCRKIIVGESEVVRRVWNQHEVELSLSLFCVEYYERLLVNGGGGRVVGDSSASSSSLKFLCMPVNV